MSSQVKSNQVTFAYAALSPREQSLCLIDTGITDRHIRTLTPAYSVKGAVSLLAGSFCQECQQRVGDSLWNLRNYSCMAKLQLCFKQLCLPSIKN